MVNYFSLKRGQIKIILLIFIMGLSFFLFSQESDPPLAELYFNRDLELSSIEDLQIWCRSLDLSDQGTLGDLKNRLRSYYDFIIKDIPDENGTPQNSGLEITIESADKTEYINWEDRGDEIHLTGGVKLTIKDPEQNRSYFLSSDSIVFSRIDDSLTAVGHVLYDRTNQDGSPEHFEGQSMTFHIKGWKGVIFQGVSSHEDSVNNKDLTFYFSGSRINSSGFDVAVMDKGMITSSKLKDPEYSIRASKIWLLGPEEWGLAHGILYLGRVPLLYLPFYYKPGNDMFFNPALGYYSREGTSIQTTTYLLGQKEPVNTSFFSAGLNSQTLYDLERKGFFLYKGEKGKDIDEDYLKVMADWYSRLGFFAGIEGDFKSDKTEWDLFAGLGFSRSIDDTSNSILYYEDQTYVSRWNSSDLGPVELPYRWGSDFSVNAGNFSLDMAYYSDPSFMADFMSQRVESFDPLNWILSDLGEEAYNEEGEINSLRWEISWHDSYSPVLTKPWLSKISINRVKSSLQWDSQLDTLKYSEDPNSPTTYFFYPRQLILPDLGISLSGRLWESDNQKVTSSPLDSDETWLIPGQEPSTDLPAESDSSSYLTPSLRGSREMEYGDIFSGSIGWDSSLSSLFQNDFDYESWTSSDQISLALDQGKMSLNNSNSLDLNISLLENLFSLSQSMDYKINQRLYIDLSGSGEELTDEQLKDQYSYDSINWTGYSSLKLNPFDLQSISGSYIKYNAAMTLYNKSYLSLDNRLPLYEEIWIGNSADSLKTSEGEIYLEYAPQADLKFSIKGVTDLYTDSRETDSKLTSHIEFRIGNLKNQLDNSFARSGVDWTINPITYLGTWNFTPYKASLSDQLTYDIEESRFSFNKTNLAFYGFNASLVSSYTDSYNWNNTSYLWEAGDKFFQFSTLNLAYGDTIYIGPFWKNRFKNSLEIKTSWNQDLIRINNSVLDFSFKYHTSIHEFMDLNISVVSQNKNIYLYFPTMRESLGIEGTYSFWEDLTKSFNFFNTNDRYESAFNLSSVKIDLIHNMGSWNGILNYTGAPEQVSGVYKWQSELSFFLQWDPIPSINISIDKNDDDNWDIIAGETEN